MDNNMTDKKDLLSNRLDNYKYWWFPWILLGLVLVSLGISIWSIVMSYASLDLDNETLMFSYDALFTIIGIILSSVALVISLYFIILGIGANSIRREIKDDSDKAVKAVEGIRKDAENIRDVVAKEFKDNKVVFVKTFDELYSELIAMTQEYYNSISIGAEGGFTHGQEEQNELLIRLKLDQSRFACDPRNLDVEIDEVIKKIIMRGINLIPDLNPDINDMKLLEEVKNKSNDKDIIGAAKNAYDKVENKLCPD